MKRFLFLLVLSFIAISFAAKVRSPSGCDKWYSGQTKTIKWDTDDLDSTVNIELYEDDDTLLQVIAEATENDGEFEWTIPFFQTEFDDCDPYIFIYSSSGYSLDYFLTGDDAARSKGFSVINPVILEEPSVADTLFKVRWTGEEVYDYDIEHRRVGETKTELVNHPSDRYSDEDLDDHVIAGLLPNTLYEYRLRHRAKRGSDPSIWTEWQQVRTYDRLQCTNEMLSAWFSLEVYDSLRSGEFAYPGFCGEWETVHGYTSRSDFAAIWTNRLTKQIIVGWRGTEGDNWEDALDNVGYLSRCSNYIEWESDDCEVSYGFGSNYKKTDYKHFGKILESAIDAGFQEIIVTGHSQGGALATVAALDYELRFGDKIQVSLITFGAPEVGNPVFADLVSTRLRGRIKQYALIDETGEPDEVTLLPSSIISVGFVPLDERYTEYLDCPLDCRENGFGILPPFYCHCVAGYWDIIAKKNINSGYQFQPLPNAIDEDWLSGEYHDHNITNGANNLIVPVLLAVLSVTMVFLI